jgi:hypothetical protein
MQGDSYGRNRKMQRRMGNYLATDIGVVADDKLQVDD